MVHKCAKVYRSACPSVAAQTYRHYPGHCPPGMSGRRVGRADRHAPLHTDAGQWSVTASAHHP